MGSHEVINYAYAEHALRNFEQDRPDLVLVDIRLEGEMSGVEMVTRLRAAGHKQPMVAVTAVATDEMRERCMTVGFDDYFTKPVPVRDLLHLIQKYATQVQTQTAAAVPSPAETPAQPEVLPAAPLPAETPPVQPEAQAAETKAEEATKIEPINDPVGEARTNVGGNGS
jgi:CheY-like chemotaxis protein